MTEYQKVKRELPLKILLLVLLLTLIGLVGTVAWASLRPITIYRDYQITMKPGMTIKVGDNVPYVASGTKLQHIDGTVTHFMDCKTIGEKADVVVRLSEVPTNSVFGLYQLKNQSPTGGALSYPQLKLPTTCFLRNTVTFNPSPLHAVVSYTAESQYNGIKSTFTLIK